MKLTDLNARFRRIVEPGKRYQDVDTLAGAQGMAFLCPKCFAANGGDVGTETLVCWFRDRGVSSDEFPKPGRWAVSGTGISDLTLRPSVNLPGPGCKWHGFVRNGDAS